MSDDPAPDAVARWEVAGGAWRVARAGGASATVELLRCDGGEVVETLTLRDERGLRWAAARLADPGRPR